MKRFGKFLTAAVLVTAAAGCVAYFTKYRDFQKSLDEDFNDFEDEPQESKEESEKEEPQGKQEPHIKREYVSIPLETPESTVCDTTEAEDEAATV